MKNEAGAGEPKYINVWTCNDAMLREGEWGKKHIVWISSRIDNIVFVNVASIISLSLFSSFSLFTFDCSVQSDGRRQRRRRRRSAVHVHVLHNHHTTEKQERKMTQSNHKKESWMCAVRPLDTIFGFWCFHSILFKKTILSCGDKMRA